MLYPLFMALGLEEQLMLAYSRPYRPHSQRFNVILPALSPSLSLPHNLPRSLCKSVHSIVKQSCKL